MRRELQAFARYVEYGNASYLVTSSDGLETFVIHSKKRWAAHEPEGVAIREAVGATPWE